MSECKSRFQAFSLLLAGNDKKIRRQIVYWAATAIFYSFGLALLWIEAWAGAAAVDAVTLLSAGVYLGIGVFYVLIRASRQLGLQPAQLADFQGKFGIVCVVIGYAIAPQVRGAALTLLVIILVFCAFTLAPAKSHRMSIFAIVLLGVATSVMVKINARNFVPRVELVHFLTAAIMLGGVAYLTGELSSLRTRLKTQKEDLANALSRIQILATRDELTSLANRRHMSEILASEERRHQLEGRSICIAMMDIDLFKKVNDTHGHAAGDDVLRGFAQQAQQSIRESDIIARWGGEEFLLLLSHTDLAAARQVVERVKENIAALDFSHIAAGMRVSFSTGLIELKNGESVGEGVIRADQAMYRAKAAGRDRIVLG